MKAEIAEKVKSCKALAGKSIADVIMMPRFRDNLTAYMKAQRIEREAARANYEKIKPFAKGMKLPSHPIDKVIGLSPEDFAAEYLAILSKQSQRPAAERIYIVQLARQAYSLTVAQIVCEEYPELRDELIPQTKNQN